MRKDCKMSGAPQEKSATALDGKFMPSQLNFLMTPHAVGDFIECVIFPWCDKFIGCFEV
jgi:hypothetical protein